MTGHAGIAANPVESQRISTRCPRRIMLARHQVVTQEKFAKRLRRPRRLEQVAPLQTRCNAAPFGPVPHQKASASRVKFGGCGTNRPPLSRLGPAPFSSSNARGCGVRPHGVLPSGYGWDATGLQGPVGQPRNPSRNRPPTVSLYAASRAGQPQPRLSRGSMPSTTGCRQGRISRLWAS